MNRTRKGMAALLCALLFVDLLPAAASAADIQEGPPAFTLNSTVVAFAGREWYVIGDGTSGVSPQSGHLTLLARTSFGEVEFRVGRPTQDDPSWTSWPLSQWYFEGNFTNPSDYNDSTLMNFLEARADAIPANEAVLIKARRLDDVTGPPVSGQKLWPLSLDECKSMGTIPGDSLSGSLWWFWLRSDGFLMGASVSHTEGAVDPAGNVYYRNTWDPSISVRPALQLNLSSVLFTSDANGASSKSSATVGSGLVGVAAPTQNIKFTMKDSAQTLVVLATTAQSTQSDASLLFSYTGATTGPNQYVSCVLVDELGAVKYYGKLADSSYADRGILNVPLSGVSDGTYTLKIFSEQANGDMYTDFASTPTAMTVSVSNGSGTVSGFGGTVLLDISGSQGPTGADGADGREIELRVNATHIQWRYEGEGNDDWHDLVTLSSLTGADGHDGVDGKEVELRVNGGYIQWRYKGDADWIDLTAVSVVAGPQGPQGASGDHGRDGRDGSDGTNGLNGKDGSNGTNGRDGQNGKDGRNGKDGNGILSVTKTGSESSVDTYAIAFMDGSSTTFTVTNGKDGVGVKSAAFNENVDLVFTLTDGTVINLGPLPASVGSVPASGTTSGNKDGPDAAVPVAAGAASGAIAAGLLYWLLPLLKKRL